MIKPKKGALALILIEKVYIVHNQGKEIQTL